MSHIDEVLEQCTAGETKAKADLKKAFGVCAKRAAAKVAAGSRVNSQLAKVEGLEPDDSEYQPAVRELESLKHELLMTTKSVANYEANQLNLARATVAAYADAIRMFSVGPVRDATAKRLAEVNREEAALRRERVQLEQTLEASDRHLIEWGLVDAPDSGEEPQRKPRPAGKVERYEPGSRPSQW